jgi:hypothetical protein
MMFLLSVFVKQVTIIVLIYIKRVLNNNLHLVIY